MNTIRNQCKRCVMDVTAVEIVFTETGCNFCDRAKQELDSVEGKIPYIKGMINKDSKYDVLIGLSGGADSSYALLLAVRLGLRPLCFSVDNGWNTKLADENIMKLVEGLKVPFYRYNIDLDKFVELQMSFIVAGQANIEIPTDHILMAVSLELADRYNIKTIISGGNVSTESIMPASWGYNARDLVHIKDVYKKMTGKKLEGLPTCSLLKWNYYKWIKGIKTVYLLDYLKYDREEAIKELSELLGYVHPGEKHCESIFTSWFQNFYLFEKFGYDKRKPHLSSMIMSGQITRDQAIAELSKSPVYPKLGIEDRVLEYKNRYYQNFKTDEKLFNFISKAIKACRF